MGTQKNHLNLKKKSLSGPLMLLYVSCVYHMISGMIKVVVSAFEIRGLSQKVLDFLYNKKTIRSIAIKFYL